MSDLLAAFFAAVEAAAEAAGEEYLVALDHAEEQKRAYGVRSREYQAADEECQAADAAAEAAWAAYVEKRKASDDAYDRWVAERRASS